MSARLRLTLSYAGFLVVAGVALIALLFYIIRFVPDGDLSGGGPFVPNRGDLLDALWPRVWQVLAVLAAIGVIGGWFLAGRMLRPLARINAVANSIAAGSLDERVRLDGPMDEFRSLADTVDSMLDRLQRSIEEQRRFAANASHELRTPYAIERSLLDLAIADPGGVDAGQLIARLDATNRRGIEVVEALLALASLDAGRAIRRRPVDLVELVDDCLGEVRVLAEEAGVTLIPALEEGDLDGDDRLLRQLVSNLVLNGIRHNRDVAGTVGVRTRTLRDGGVELTVTNTGPVVPSELVTRLTEPFFRVAGRVSATGARPGSEGSGLGLALAARIVDVHGARLHIEAPPSGGLAVRVRFAAPSTAVEATRRTG
ncbi:HAMP domain-containing histidine kinase [Plantibacter flavus]|uniref:sensor histidine kinase n=1 Tax=Plantibacter flavus TaxID=150123 RepID=UPI003F18146C